MKSSNIYSSFHKKTLKFLSNFFIIAIFLLVSCDKLLEEAPKSVVAENFFTTSQEFEAALNAIYPTLRNNRAEYLVRLDAQTDWGYGRGSRSVYNTFTGLPSIDFHGGFWSAFYLMVRDANWVIQNASVNTSVSKADLDKFAAEAKFLRAYAYFQLVRNWGAIPLRTELNTTDKDLKKSTAAEVYDFIIADLKIAEANLPEVQALLGKPTKYAAKTLLADVYLTAGKYAESRDKIKEVIQSNKYALVPVTSKSDFQLKIFGPDLVTSTEEIFYCKCTRTPGAGNSILWILNAPITGYFNFGGAYAHYSDLTNPFYVTWNNSDIRKSLWDNVNFGLGPNTLVCNKFIDTKAPDAASGGNDYPLYRYSEALLIYAEASCMASNGPTAEGVEAINKVHRRAYGKDPNAPSAVDFNISDYNASSFQNLVLQERGYEFIFEGKRWLDLKRANKAAAVILAVRGITIAEKAYLWPIPSTELNYNKALDPAKDQNPGY